MSIISRAIKLHDQRFGNEWKARVEDHWDYADFRNDPRWRKGWISFDCALYEPGEDRIYLGITSFDGDIFRAYDRRTQAFIDLGYRRIVDSFDAKFHRSLEHGPDGCIYGAIALLHCVDHYHDAPGGAIVRYNPATGELAKIAIPIPHTYIQSIAIDHRRLLIYCLCFPPEKICTFDLRTAEVRDFGLIGTGIGGMCQGENICLDDNGCCWTSWQMTRAWQGEPGVDCQRLYKIDPTQSSPIFYQKGPPRPDGKHGTTKIEGLFNLGDGMMYASGGNGSLFEINPASGDSRFLFTPISDRRSRLTSLITAPDGYAYGITGRDGKCQLLRFDFRRKRFDLVGDFIRDSASGEAMWQCHHLVLTPDGVIYACENDVPHRSGYLWEISGVWS